MSRLMRKVNSDEACDNYDSVDSFREALPWDEERVTYISTRWDVSRNCARALILSEVGKDINEIADLLYVTDGTAKKYISELSDKIHYTVVMPIEHKVQEGVKWDVWGSGETEPPRSTEKKHLDPKFRPQEHNVNKGAKLENIPTDLIEVNV